VERAGADCLLVLPPYYSNAPEEGLYDYYEAIARASGLPLMVYSRDWAVFSPQMVARLAERLPTLLAWKDGQGDARKYQRIMSHVGDRLAWLGGIGDDCVPAYFAIGVQAYTSSISNIAPKVSLQLAAAGLARDFTRLDQLMRRYVHPLYALRERMRGYEVSVVKTAMEILGMPAGPVRPPLTNCRPEDVEDVRKLMEVYRDVIEERESGERAERSPAGAGRMSR
jgi:5-dehydro-4-deoxyglucarate dehydratase